MNKVHKINGFVYVTSEEVFKEGINTKLQCDNGKCYYDWYYNVLYNVISNVGSITCNDFKIILTNDPNLTTVQQLTPQEVEYLNGVDECEVKKIEDELISPKNSKIRFDALQDPPSFISTESLNNMILTYKYKIIIPKEEIQPEDIWNEEKLNMVKKAIEEHKQQETLYTAQQVTEYAYYFEKCYAERPMKKPLLPTDYFNQNKKK